MKTNKRPGPKPGISAEERIRASKEIELHLEVLSIVLSREEFKGYELGSSWIADFCGLTPSTITNNAFSARARLKDSKLREWHDN